MRFEDSSFSKSIAFTKVVLDFGIYYLCGNFYILEVNEGVHFNSQKFDLLLSSLLANNGHHKSLAHISNRVNAYSIDPFLWSYFDIKDTILIGGAIVSYRDGTFLSANIEKQMASIPVKRALSLEEAINWVNQLAELN